ncbi:MAG: nucleotidyltransferase domain-containing protein [Steroidobacteraceae bacterium]
MPAMRPIDSITASAIRAFLGRLPKGGVRLERALLYGSRARGDYSSESDADLALVLPEGGRRLAAALGSRRNCIRGLSRDRSPHSAGSNRLFGLGTPGVLLEPRLSQKCRARRYPRVNRSPTIAALARKSIRGDNGLDSGPEP